MAVQNENTPPLRSSQPAVDIPGFFEAVIAASEVFLQTEGPPDNTKPKIVHEFPRERLAITDDPLDVITFKVLKSTMAPTTNDGRAPRSPKQRESKPHPTLKGFNLVTQGWWELVQAEFSVWSKSSRNADSIAYWFHIFMMKYAFIYKYFMSRGVANFRFVERADDDVDHSWNQELYRRRLTYEFRLETLIGEEAKQLTDLTVNYGVSGANDSISIQPEQ